MNQLNLSFSTNPLPEKSETKDVFEIFADGGARDNPGPAGCGWVIKKNKQVKKQGKKFLNHATNNQAEYQALIEVLKDAETLKIEKIKIFLDSELIVKQVKGEYRVKNQDLFSLFLQVKKLLENFSWSIQHIPRKLNKEADLLVNQVIDENLNK